MAYLFVLLTILLTVYGQFVIKWQALRAGTMPGDWAGRASFVVAMLCNPWVLSALAAAFAASLCWMLAMTRLRLSEAYPFTALAFVLVVLGGAWLFSEPLTPLRIASVVLIALGVTLAGFA